MVFKALEKLGKFAPKNKNKSKKTKYLQQSVLNFLVASLFSNCPEKPSHNYESPEHDAGA